MIFGQTSVFPRKAKSHLFDKLRVPQASLAGHASRTTAAVPRKAPGEEGAVSAARPCGAKWMSDAVCGFMLSLMLSFQRDPDCLSAALPKRDPPSPPSSLSSAPRGRLSLQGLLTVPAPPAGCCSLWAVRCTQPVTSRNPHSTPAKWMLLSPPVYRDGQGPVQSHHWGVAEPGPKCRASLHPQPPGLLPRPGSRASVRRAGPRECEAQRQDRRACPGHA